MAGARQRRCRGASLESRWPLGMQGPYIRPTSPFCLQRLLQERDNLGLTYRNTCNYHGKRPHIHTYFMLSVHKIIRLWEH